MAAKSAQRTAEKQQAGVEELQKAAQEVQKLVRLSQQDNENEARNAALAAATLIAKHDFVCVPREHFEATKKAVEGARALAKKAKGEKMQNLVLGFLAAQLFGKSGLRL